MPLDIQKKIEAIIKEEIQYTSNLLGFNLLLSRLKRRYNSNPTPEELSSCMDDVKAFVSKYEAMMDDEYNAIRNI